MGIDFNELKKRAEGLAEQHGDKIDSAAEKAGEFAKRKFGHDEQIDQAVDRIQQWTPENPRPDNPDTPQPGNKA
ncbi:antitoxin [Actinokineospora fastidiosa]|uniref:MT0933-like antitoxin protein n=1 Tax=Actinokineospora fastidiosa TaxID=1816 RepID=A0A918L7Q7_9PSEU|nr:antitoxin [Actinokineospora fastidiosa]GGS17569.1 hypothetical protein GCM10010171_07530 [Actinokineospora fastidiosa]